MHTRKRSTFVLVFVLTICMTSAARAQSVDEPPFILTKMAPHVWAAIHNPRSKAPAGANAGFVIGDDGVIVVDSFANAAAATALLAEIRKLTPLPVRFVVNTHYHADHVAGNGVFVKAGATVMAQRNVRGWVHPENLRLIGKNIKPDLKAFVDGLVVPTMGYEQAVDLHLGSRVIQIRAFPGHTGGDSFVFIPDAKVAFGGDLFWRNTVPNTIDASSKLWIETLGTVATMHPDYTFVPGHGEVGNAQDVGAFRDYLAALQQLVADARAQGKAAAALVETVLPALKEKYGSWDFFPYLAPLNIREAEAELSGKKQIPEPLRTP